MDERFEDPSEEADDEEATADDKPTEDTPDGESRDSDPTTATEGQSRQQRETPTAETESSIEESDDEPLNIREDWDSATIYVEPEQSEDIEVTFTRLKKQLKREDITLEKNKHFYRGIFDVAFGEHQEETKERIRELAKQDQD
ncbi:hypothetical protein [Halorubrum miltondacostae]|jgi:hypothetical protein|uniref:DUF8160 domain-containing protein n=1 Tax=Halorubrum miltondacostae TaxID=3076378 RepID=A0ABD5M5Q5_9EURY